MGFRDAWAALWGSKASATGRALALYLNTPGSALWGKREYAKFADEGYVRSSVTFACISLIARSCASVPLTLMNGKAEIESHAILTLLKRPNPFTGGRRFFESVVSYYQISGNAYIEGVSLDGVPKELHALRPDRMKVSLDELGQPTVFDYTIGRTTTQFRTDLIAGVAPILHLKSFHPTDDIYGLSAIEAAAYDIDTHSSAKAWNKALIDNGARPSGALTTGKQPEGQRNLDDKQFERLEKQLNEKFMGATKAGRPMILEGGLDWVEMSMTPKDMDFVEGLRQAAREVALAFGVPPMILGIPGDNTYSNYQEANAAFWRQTVIPLWEVIVSDLSAWLNLVRAWRGLELVPDWDSVPALAVERYALWDKVEKFTSLKLNEKRAAVGYDDVPDGDVILVDSSKVPLADAVAPPDNGGAPPNPDDPANQDAGGKPTPPKKPKGPDAGNGSEAP